MKKIVAWALGAAMLAGCGSHAGLATPDSTVKAVSARQNATVNTFTTGAPAPTLVGNGSANLESAAAPEINAPRFDMDPFKRAEGLIKKFDVLKEEDLKGYKAQLMPMDTQIRADNTARAWAKDAKQVYIGWGFWKTPMLGQNQHFYYSPSKKKKLIITYKLVTWKSEQKEEDAPNFDLAYKILKGAADAYNYNGTRAHSRAKQAGYTPTGRNEVGVLIHPIVLGPQWVFLDNEDHQYPLVAVDAHSGEPYRDGLKMMAIRYMFNQK
jgi:hypothetical protein